jgi:DNA helicase-2/ATP-dependent DNA helicase PcrA
MATGNAAEIEEERRLLYVAMTRARHHLHLLVPQRFYVTQQSATGDRHLYGSLSRFVPPALHDLFEHVAPAPARAPGASHEDDAAPASAAVDVGARVRSLWA